jgi:hypothetical protein
MASGEGRSGEWRDGISIAMGLGGYPGKGTVVSDSRHQKTPPFFEEASSLHAYEVS